MGKRMCLEWEEQLSLYVDGLLNPFDENAVEAHLARCEGCRATVHLWKAIGAAIRRTPSYSPPAELRHQILACTTRRPKRSFQWRFAWWQLAPAFGMGLLLAWVSFPTPTASPPLHTVSQPTNFTVPSKWDASPPARTPEIAPMETETSRVNVVVAVETRPTFRVSPNIPRLVSTNRVSMLESASPEPVPAVMESVSPSSRASIVTEIAEANYETPPMLLDVPSTSAPTSNTDTPPRPDRLLRDWQDQLNQQTRDPRLRPWAGAIDSLFFHPFPFIPIVSLQPK